MSIIDIGEPIVAIKRLIILFSGTPVEGFGKLLKISLMN
tara:strand:+ start:62 stop:178 length:117 start_codon:yes stop_codon:yes gene_type:complete